MADSTNGAGPSDVRRVLITGPSSGIGLATAVEFAGAGLAALSAAPRALGRR